MSNRAPLHRGLKCRRCGGEFDALSPLARYCSERCATDAYLDRRQERREEARGKTCAECATPFTAPRSDARFCSPKCRQAAYRQRRVTAIGYPNLEP